MLSASINDHVDRRTSLLQKLSIIIPTYGRNYFAMRNMKYWSNRFARVLVVDGSPTSVDESELKRFEPNIEFYHLPDLGIENRLKFAASKLSSEFAVICGDDDMMLPSALSDAIQFLSDNPDYSSCGGRCIGFRYQDGYLSLFAVKPIQARHIVDQECKLERVFYHINEFTPSTIYAVHRTATFLNTVDSLQNFSNGGYTSELIFELLSAASGKSRVLPSPLWLRSYENPVVVAPKHNRKISLVDWYDNPENSEEVAAMYKILYDTVYELGEHVERSRVCETIRQAVEGRIAGDRESTLEREANGPSAAAKSLSNATALVRRMAKAAIIRARLPIPERYVSNYYYSNSRYSFHNLANTHHIEFADVAGINEIWQTILDFHRSKTFEATKLSA